LHLVGFFYVNYTTMHGSTNVKYSNIAFYENQSRVGGGVPVFPDGRTKKDTPERQPTHT
jgi:hypothetical protein